MELRYGSGQPTALLDMTTGKVVMYNGTEESRELHARFGGSQFYSSRSGLSGAGFVPSSVVLRKCGVLRTDDARPAIPWQGETLPGLRVVVPTKHLQRNGDAPLIAVRGHEIFFMSSYQLRAFLCGEWVPIRCRELKLSAWQYNRWQGGPTPTGKVLTECQLSVVVHSDYHWKFGKLSTRRVLELLLWEQLYDKEALSREPETPWSRGLGLVTGSDGHLYHAAGGILRRKVEMDREVLQRACPWVQFVGDSDSETADSLVYIKEGAGSFALFHPNEPTKRSVFRDDGGLKISVEAAATILSSGSLTTELKDLLLKYAQDAEEHEAACETTPDATIETEPDKDGLSEWERDLLEGDRK